MFTVKILLKLYAFYSEVLMFMIQIVFPYGIAKTHYYQTQETFDKWRAKHLMAYGSHVQCYELRLNDWIRV